MLPRRRWLGGLTAALGALVGWKGRTVVAAPATDRAAFSATDRGAQRPPMLVRPAPDSVKRHG
jgi:hypothetical protein